MCVVGSKPTLRRSKGGRFRQGGRRRHGEAREKFLEEGSESVARAETLLTFWAGLRRTNADRAHHVLTRHDGPDLRIPQSGPACYAPLPRALQGRGRTER